MKSNQSEMRRASKSTAYVPIVTRPSHSQASGKGAHRNAMPDVVSARMRAVQQRNTAPEVSVRRIVYSLGARYRVCNTRLPGRPDLSNTAQRWCILVHGCFWHGHSCQRGRLPKSNLGFWRPKIKRNRFRDAEVLKQLRACRYRVLVIWQCQLTMSSLRSRISRFLRVRHRGGNLNG